MESARVSGSLGRWSIAAASPAWRLRVRGAHSPFKALARAMKSWRAAPDARVPFGGGAIGYFSYECASRLEPRRAVAHRPGPFADAHFLFFDRVVVFDHLRPSCYLVYCADAGTTARAAGRAFDALRRTLERAPKARPRRRAGRTEQAGGALYSTLDRERFVERVRRIREHIARGDIFQANLTQLIRFDAPRDLEAVYTRLKALNPSPFFGMLRTDREQILSGSPERLLRLEGRRLDTRPIAGTRPRGASQSQNRDLSRELFLSPKERAEHVMLVDLERNDLGRVCESGSVRVDEFMAREEYSHVQHIVSNVEGRLRDGLGGLDALAAFFPGGTITGAPKVRAMEIIRQMEPEPRGPYTGSLGYLSVTGDMDFNILIRSLYVQGARAYVGAGAGIVADSDPDKEYDETLYKAHAVLQAVLGRRRAQDYLRFCGVSGPRVP